MTDKPTPKEIDLLVRTYLGDCGPQANRVYSFVTAVLAKWGQPAQAAEPADTVVLTAAQESLGVEFEKVLHDNLFDLYEESPHTARLESAQADSVQEDAARYRFLRNGEWRDTELEPFIRLQLNALWDSKIDAAIAAQQGEKTDKELLELAAKAAGYKIDEDCYRLDVRDSSGAPTEWNPFTDDGDALRLAVKLGLRVCIDSRSRFTWVKGIEGSTAHGNDATAATRRSIVRAAAEIGKNGVHGIK